MCCICLLWISQNSEQPSSAFLPSKIPRVKLKLDKKTYNLEWCWSGSRDGRETITMTTIMAMIVAAAAVPIKIFFLLPFKSILNFASDISRRRVRNLKTEQIPQREKCAIDFVLHLTSNLLLSSPANPVAI